MFLFFTGSSSTAAAGVTSEGSSKESGAVRAWKVGDKCMAVWSEDSQWYDAVIDAITDDGLVAITFDGFGNSDVTNLSALKERIPNEKKGLHRPGFGDSDKNKRKVVEAQRQQAKKRKQRKHDRQKQIEEAHEADKAKWLAFSTKVRCTKKLKGVTKKSIFATPDAANGRVGIGTCGIGGKPMTESLTHAAKVFAKVKCRAAVAVMTYDGRLFLSLLPEPLSGSCQHTAYLPSRVSGGNDGLPPSCSITLLPLTSSLPIAIQCYSNILPRRALFGHQTKHSARMPAVRCRTERYRKSTIPHVAHLFSQHGPL
ncbi:hypothetical protein O3P69_015226 [Scylla paramamosain]|uniref:Survival of motor neuron-related-splicing factor 30 n=1 Tax=Scylla paramamosain TaxID=85552 RepID=A0AAW0T578_SCYPA